MLDRIRTKLSGEYSIMQLPLLFLFMFLYSIVLMPLFLIGLYLFDGTIDFVSLANGDLMQLNPTILNLLNGVQSIALFVLPPLTIAYLYDRSPLSYLSLNKGITATSVAVVIILTICYAPLMEWVAFFNEQLSLPESLSHIERYFRSMEDNARELTEAFLLMDSGFDLMLNLLLIAVIPAVGEELIFRGFLQRLISERCRNYHVAIWLTAAIFSAIHFQFYGFLPRMLMGAMFGYLLVWSGSIWYPIIAHFINNGVAVIAVYVYGIESLDHDGDSTTWYLALGSFLIVGALLVVFYSKQDREVNSLNTKL